MRQPFASLVFCLVLILCLPLPLPPGPVPARASAGPLDYGRVNAFELLLELAIKNGTIAGGVVVVGNRAGIVAMASRGTLSGAPGVAPLDDRSVFDLASLTKVLSTAPAVMKLVEAGRLALDDPLNKWFPEFGRSCRAHITVGHLLTHTSGLVDLKARGAEALKETIARAAAENGHLAVGTFNYADLNFILLGELVRRVSGRPLDVFCREELYAPLGATTMGFMPKAGPGVAIAPTAGNAPGVVQDGNSRRLGGVAGHAGLFASGADLARFARMMLGRGELDGKRILAPATVERMTAPIACGTSTLRGMGWDIQSAYSAPKGRLCSATSYGHSGYSGSSLWIDPARNLFVVILTNRLDYREVGPMRQLRSDVATVAAAAFGAPEGERAAQALPAARLPAVALVKVAARPGKQAKVAKKGGKRHGVRTVAAAGRGGKRPGRPANRAT